MGRAHEVRAASMAKTAAAKSKLFAKWAKEIYMAAKSGVPDPEMNQSLKRIIERAKKEQVTADVIKRSIEKAKGGSAESYTSLRYEGFGPLKTSIIVDCLSDNVSRTAAVIKNCFTKCGGMFGSVQHQFDHQAIFSTSDLTEEEAFEALINGDCNGDVESEDGLTYIYGEANEYSKIREALTAYKSNINFEDDQITFLPTSEVELTTDEEIAKFTRFLGLLNDSEDVQEIYHNAKYEEPAEEE
jgi:YebC/PmpR family DNA-binding regulatory protein